jgi:sucrose-6-phosphate hydrolase SacC (GH32 family)
MIWSPEEIETLSTKYGIRPECKLHDRAEDFHFPDKRFLAEGYAPPGGYVKDFGVIMAEGRLHLFHIDGRPGEICYVTGNEISFGHASTSDFCRWIRHPMPLAVGERSWESEHVWAPYIYKRAAVYYMFYMGNGHGETFMSYATSTDLERWTRRPEGPIRCAVGRDPFVFDQDDRAVLFYTAHAGGARISACTSRDMAAWEPLSDPLFIDHGEASGNIESCSMHPLDGRYVLWFNDYRTVYTNTPPGYINSNFRAAYAVSDDPLHFNQETIREFRFVTDTPGVTPCPGLDKPTPLSIERVAARDSLWLVAYFRWQIDRDRLFFGTLDWSADPAVIREINNEEELRSVLRQVL